MLSTIATCGLRRALGSYVAISLALVALLQATLPVVSLALEDLPLPDQTLIDDLVRVFGSGGFDNDGRH